MSEIEKKWYVLRAISGKEAKVKEYLDTSVTEIHISWKKIMERKKLCNFHIAFKKQTQTLLF